MHCNIYLQSIDMRTIEEKEGLEAKKLGGWNAGSGRGGWRMERRRRAQLKTVYLCIEK